MGLEKLVSKETEDISPIFSPVRQRLTGNFIAKPHYADSGQDADNVVDSLHLRSTSLFLKLVRFCIMITSDVYWEPMHLYQRNDKLQITDSFRSCTVVDFHSRELLLTLQETFHSQSLHFSPSSFRFVEYVGCHSRPAVLALNIQVGENLAKYLLS